MKLLTTEEYQETLFPNMTNVTSSAEELVDLWEYADLIIDTEYHNCTAWEWKVDHIYESPNGAYQHIGIPVPSDNTYLIIIIDKKSKHIKGHYNLELDEK